MLVDFELVENLLVAVSASAVGVELNLQQRWSIKDLRLAAKLAGVRQWWNLRKRQLIEMLIAA